MGHGMFVLGTGKRVFPFAWLRVRMTTVVSSEASVGGGVDFGAGQEERAYSVDIA